MKAPQRAGEWAARLAAGGRRFHLLLIGQGPFAPKVRAQVEAAGLGDRISILGFVDDLPAAMAALDVGLYSALESDGMPRVLFEYLAAGVPVVASRVAGVPESLEGGCTARLRPPREPQPLVD